jgi:hypothetical protein
MKVERSDLPTSKSQRYFFDTHAELKGKTPRFQNLWCSMQRHFKAAFELIDQR